MPNWSGRVPKMYGKVTEWSGRVIKWSGRVPKWSGRVPKWSGRVGSGPVMIYRAIQLIQIFLADERTDGLTKVI